MVCSTDENDSGAQGKSSISYQNSKPAQKKYVQDSCVLVRVEVFKAAKFSNWVVR